MSDTDPGADTETGTHGQDRDPADIDDERLHDLCDLVGTDPEPDLRVAAVEKLLSVAETAPERFDKERLRVLAQGLPEAHGDTSTTRPGETRLTHVFYRVGRADAELIDPVADRLVSALLAHARAFHNFGAMSNIAFPVGAVLADDHGALGEPRGRLVGALVRLIESDCEYARHARHSIAWATERRAVAYPEATARKWSRLERVVEAETYSPALKHLARLVAHLERARPGLATGIESHIGGVLCADTERVVVAGCMALGAVGSEAAVSSLEGLVETTDSQRLRTAGWRALREATVPRDAHPALLEPLSTVSVAAVADRVDPGDWLGMDTRRFPARTGRLRARVDTVDRTPDGWHLDLENPYGGYELTLTGPDKDNRTDQDSRDGGSDRPVGTYTDERQSGTMTFRPEQFWTVADDLLPLLYALPADHLSFTVEGRPSHVVVTAVDHGPERRRVRCRDRQRGQDVEFRLCSHHPRRALFDPGRALPAAEFSLAPRESLSE